MKYTGLYLVGFGLLAAGLLLALWRLGVLAMLGNFWTGVVVLALLGVGIMVSVMNATARRTIEIDRT